MPNQFICNAFRSLFFTGTFAVAVSIPAATPRIQNDFESVKPVEWTSNIHPSIGSASSPIQIIFFVDYQCPSCRIADPLIRRAVARRPDTALIYREFPLVMHAFAKSAAIVAENASAHGTFELAHKWLMNGQTLTEATVKVAARKAGTSTKATAFTTMRLESDQNLARKAKLNYVPCFVVVEQGRSTLMSKQQVLDFLR